MDAHAYNAFDLRGFRKYGEMKNRDRNAKTKEIEGN